MTITGGTRLLAVIGDPIAHSLSPLIHNAWLAETGLDYVYLAFRVSAGGCADFLTAAKTLPIAGFNATMPLKEELFPLMDRTDETALGSVNTIVNENGRFFGASTDGDGFIRALKSYGRNAAGLKTVLLGSGGAAKTVAPALLSAGADLSVCVRDRQKARGIAGDRRVFGWESLAELCAGADLLVNATPLGMEGFAEFGSLDFVDVLPKRAMVFDLVYSPPQTGLLRRAAGRGLEIANGLSHLIHQAALSFKYFTDIEPDEKMVADVAKLCNDALHHM